MELGENSWSKREDEILSKMAFEGYSATEISHHIKRTRNAIIGRANRTGIKLGRKEGKPKQELKKIYDPLAKVAAPLAQATVTFDVIPKIKKYVNGLSLVDAEKNMCRWIITGDKICGEETHQGSYCQDHRRIVFTQSSARPPSSCSYRLSHGK